MSDLDPEVLLPLLRGRLGRPYRMVETTPSTQRLLGESDPEGTTVAADVQTAGRGRLGRVWLAPAGKALLFSIQLRPRSPMAIWPELSLVAGEAVATALRRETGVAAELGPPNDVLVERRKLVGVLPEAVPGRVVLGVGLNVSQTANELPGDAPKPPTSLLLETGRVWPRAALLAAILLELERAYDAWQELHAPR